MIKMEKKLMGLIRDGSEEGECFLNIMAVDMTKEEQKEVRTELRQHGFTFDIIDADMVLAHLTDRDVATADEVFEVLRQLEKDGWSW